MSVDEMKHDVKKDDAFTLGPLQVGPACCDPHPVIQVENLSLHYGNKTALDNVTLDIYRGCITALIGPSGCGKTSFLSAINRLTDMIPDCKVEGSIRVEDNDIHVPASDVQVLRRQIGMVFQKPMPFPLSIR
ncbi:MAG: ATP-binding cassette domain-containing protein, partial [Nitrosomonas sp.]|nr:ATP-binding cassette domain-containing protein [Nitrosomonas sp.]